VIAVEGLPGVIGWWDGSGWVSPEEAAEIPMEGDETFQIAKLGRSGAVTTRGMETNEDFIPYCFPGRTGPVFADDLALGSWTYEGFISGVVVSAPWRLQPRPVSVGASREGLEKAAIKLLAAEGYEADAVEIVQAIDADLDGDGAVETIAAVNRGERGLVVSDAYGMIFVVRAGSDPEVVAKDVTLPRDEGTYTVFRVGAVADISGDGVMELVVSWSEWEWAGVSIYELTDDGFSQVLDSGCGV